MHLKGYGCAGRSAVEYGLAAMELEAGDSGLRTFVSVQGSLAMSAIHKHGSEEQKQQWLPGMATGELIGCFGLTEPTAGSDPGGMTTYARRDGSDWVLTGAKRWIGLASIAAGRGDLGADRRGDPRVRRSDGYPGVHRDPDRAEAVDAGLHPVRHHPGRRAAARGRGAAECGGPEGPVRLPERGPVRDHLGRHGRGPGLLRGRAALQPAAEPVRQAAGRLPAHPAQARRHGPGNPEGHPGRAADRAAEGRRNAVTRSRSRSAS